MSYEYGIPVGLKNVYFAPVIEDCEAGAVYEKPFKIGDSISVVPSFEFAEGSLDAEDKRIREVSELMGINFQINTTRLSTEVQSKLLGHRIDANGGLVMEDGDMPSEGALLYQVTLDNGKSKFVCIFKGVFKEFAEEAQTKKGGSLEYQTPTIEFSAYRRADGRIRYEISEETEGYSKEAVASWFDKVPEPAAENREESAIGNSVSR